jgi:hypothetical protein
MNQTHTFPNVCEKRKATEESERKQSTKRPAIQTGVRVLGASVASPPLNPQDTTSEARPFLRKQLGEAPPPSEACCGHCGTQTEKEGVKTTKAKHNKQQNNRT